MLAQRTADAAAIEPATPAIHEVDTCIALSEVLRAMPTGVRTAHYRAQLLRLHIQASLEQITAAMTGLGVELIDCLDAQLIELCKIRRPRDKLGSKALAWDATQLCPPRERLRYGVWAFYPWSRRLVHLVNEREFVELRTNRNLYKISPAEQDALQTKRIGIVGASAGQAIALAVATERSCGEIRLADFDQLDATNLNRLRGGVHQLGVAKVVITAREIAEIDPFLDVRCESQGINERNIGAFLSEGGKLDMVIEESDSLDIKFLVREEARARRIPVLMDTSDRGLLDVERFDLEPSRPLFHGMAPELDPRTLSSLSTEAKIPHMLDLLGVENVSTRLKASMLEIDQTITTWPQLASSVFMGGAIAADTARRILLGEGIASGRYYVDLQQLIPAHIETVRQVPPASSGRAHHSDAQLKRFIDALPQDDAIHLDKDTVSALVAAGISAPSGGNAQPWRWVYGRATLLLMREHAGDTFLDFEGRGGLAAVGAAAENACLAAGNKGLRAQCHTFPVDDDLLCAAALRFFPAQSDHRASEDIALATQIFERRTDRRLGARTPLPVATVNAMRAATAAIPGARLEIVSSTADLAQLERILGVTQQLLLQHSEAHLQMMREIQWDDPHAPTSDYGIPVQSLALSALDRAGLEICREHEVLRLNQTWGGGAGLRKYAEKAVRAASGFALVVMAEGGTRSYVDGGRAMQRAWLAACAHKLAVQPLSALPYLFARLRADRNSLPDWFAHHLAELWPSFSSLFGTNEDEAGVLLFRLAEPAGALPTAAPRRPVSQVLRFL